MIRNIVSVSAIAVLMSLAVVSSVEARGKAAHTTLGCTADKARLCPQSPPNKAAPCLKKHMSELSPACKAKMQGK